MKPRDAAEAATHVDGSSAVTVWWDEPADGPVNMAADECLALEAERIGGFVMRFYGWSSTTISLGGFQALAEAEAIAAIRGVPLVRRPSGGGAIVHGTDLTYAAAVPKGHPWGGRPQALYDALHGAMAEVLAERGVQAWPCAAAEPAPGVEPSFFCFDRRATGDLVMARPARDDGAAAEMRPRPAAKIMGSAQRRLPGAVLQHGSLLLAANADVGGAARHPGVAELLPRCPVSAVEIATAWTARIARRLDAKLRDDRGPFLPTREQLVCDRARRFRDRQWTGRR